MIDEVLARMNLRTKPFSPEKDKEGVAFPPRLVAGELDPQADPRLISLYFDFYDWRTETLLGILEPDVTLKNFPDDQHRPVLVIVSGGKRSGRGSLINLILHKINDLHASEPLVVVCQFGDFDQAKNARAMAQRFVDEYSFAFDSPAAEKLDALLKRADAESGQSKAPYANLFLSLKSAVARTCTRPIVFILRGVGSDELWAVCYNSASALADYVIVETSKVADAESCRRTLDMAGRHVAHVYAREVDLDRARRYVRSRLAAERIVEQDAIDPFTDEAISVLYNPGSAASGDVEHSIGWLRDTLRVAMDRHLAELVAIAMQNGGADAIPVEKLMLTAETVSRIRNELNAGSRGVGP